MAYLRGATTIAMMDVASAASPPGNGPYAAFCCWSGDARFFVACLDRVAITAKFRISLCGCIVAYISPENDPTQFSRVNQFMATDTLKACNFLLETCLAMLSYPAERSAADLAQLQHVARQTQTSAEEECAEAL